jgi:hypothetical protein
MRSPGPADLYTWVSSTCGTGRGFAPHRPPPSKRHWRRSPPKTHEAVQQHMGCPCPTERPARRRWTSSIGAHCTGGEELLSTAPSGRCLASFSTSAVFFGSIRNTPYCSRNAYARSADMVSRSFRPRMRCLARCPPADASATHPFVHCVACLATGTRDHVLTALAFRHVRGPSAPAEPRH